MKLTTDYIGEIEYSEEEVLIFEEGLYGFSELKKYLIVLNPAEELPFHWLQSLEDERLTFIITSPFLFVDQYDFDLPEMVAEALEIHTHEDIDIYSLTVIPEKIQDTTINLKAPLILNRNNKKGKQLILNEEYPYKHKIFAKGI